MYVVSENIITLSYSFGQEVVHITQTGTSFSVHQTFQLPFCCSLEKCSGG